MMRFEIRVAGPVIAAIALTFSTAVFAQSPGSAFSGYQPYREQPLKPWKDANQEVAENPGMGSMSGMAGHNMAAPDSKGGAAGHDMSSMPGMGAKAGSAQKLQAAAAGHDMSSMPGMGAKAGAAQKPQAAAAGHDMGSMKGMPGMPGMAAKAGTAPKPHADDGHAHDKGSMQAMPGMASKSGSSTQATADGKAGHDMGAMKSMPGMAPKSAAAPAGPLIGTGVVRSVDKANGKVRLTHDPIDAMGWPKLTLSFRLKDNALADRVTDGDSVEFSLEKSASGYVISDLRKNATVRTKPAK